MFPFANPKPTKAAGTGPVVPVGPCVWDETRKPAGITLLTATQYDGYNAYRAANANSNLSVVGTKSVRNGGDFYYEGLFARDGKSNSYYGFCNNDATSLSDSLGRFDYTVGIMIQHSDGNMFIKHDFETTQFGVYTSNVVLGFVFRNSTNVFEVWRNNGLIAQIQTKMTKAYVPDLYPSSRIEQSGTVIKQANFGAKPFTNNLPPGTLPVNSA